MDSKIVVGTVVFLVVAAAVAGLAGRKYEQERLLKEFQQWKREFGVEYDGVEDQYRLLIFLKNLEKVEKHNADPTQTYQLGINQFAAITTEQFSMKYLNPIPYSKDQTVEINE